MKYVALFLGFALLALGIASFVPQASVDGALFGITPVSVVMGLVLIAAGVIGVMAGLWRTRELQTPAQRGQDLREWLA